MDAPIVFEKNGLLYIVGPVAPITPADDEVEEFAFATALRSTAPNDKILWLRGQYVEADKPNRNGQLWTGNELAIKSLTPRLMPVTVMHDPRTAVGLIADTKLLVPDTDNVPRARIDTALAIWKHRFPEIAEEAMFNYEKGTLMQSMECEISHYSCTDCGRGFVKLPQNAERANWCDHLRESSAVNGIAVRRLEGVTFTGTGLILGTRNGATGALDTAHLDVFQSEVAEFHERAHTERPTRRHPVMDEITIKRSEYDKLTADAAKAGELAAATTALDASKAEVATLTSRVEALEISEKAAKTELATEKAAREALEESARAVTLSGDRVGKLGTAFVAKLSDGIKARLTEQAKTLSDEDWTARLEELAELTGVKADEAAAADAATTTSTTRTETASTQLGGHGGATEPSRAAVSTVLGGLFSSLRPATPTPAGK